jgi:hypothetical protein
VASLARHLHSFRGAGHGPASVFPACGAGSLFSPIPPITRPASSRRAFSWATSGDPDRAASGRGVRVLSNSRLSAAVDYTHHRLAPFGSPACGLQPGANSPRPGCFVFKC